MHVDRRLILLLAFAAVALPAAARGLLSLVTIPVEAEFAWSRSVASAAASISMLLFGLTGPFVAGFVARVGLRRVMLLGLLLMAVSLALAPAITDPWLFVAVWGVGMGLASGILGIVLGSIVAQQWFPERRGMATGVLSAAIATMQLVYLPPGALLVEQLGWRVGAAVTAALAGGVLLAAWKWMQDPPRGEELAVAMEGRKTRAGDPLRVLSEVVRVPAFWFVALPFATCGATAAGLIGIHLIPAAADHGMPEVRTSLVLALMGVLDLGGSVASGWLSDRYDNRGLLAGYFVARGVALLGLPFALAAGGLALGAFAVVYGLGWVATVPPTARLCSSIFGAQRGPVVFGWVFAGHQVGAAAAALGAGVLHDILGSYDVAFISAGFVALSGAGMSLLIRAPSVRPAPPAVPA